MIHTRVSLSVVALLARAQGFLPALPPDVAVEFHVFQSQLILSVYILQISTRTFFLLCVVCAHTWLCIKHLTDVLLWQARYQQSRPGSHHSRSMRAVLP
jgi:hypothetical protein